MSRDFIEEIEKAIATEFDNRLALPPALLEMAVQTMGAERANSLYVNEEHVKSFIIGYCKGTFAPEAMDIVISKPSACVFDVEFVRKEPPKEVKITITA